MRPFQSVWALIAASCCVFALAAPARAESNEASKKTDHENVVNRIGVGYLGSFSIPSVATTPIVGARYWLTEGLGVQAGLGVSAGRSNFVSEQPDSDSNNTDFFATTVHAAAPFVLFYDEHYKFLFIPELNIGFGLNESEGQREVFNDDFENSVFAIGLAAKVGAEIHFGFIGLPMLSIQGTVGVNTTFSTRKETRFTDASGQSEFSRRTRSFSFGTTQFSDVLDFFSSNVAAIYYF